MQFQLFNWISSDFKKDTDNSPK